MIDIRITKKIAKEYLEWVGKPVYEVKTISAGGFTPPRGMQLGAKENITLDDYEIGISYFRDPPRNFGFIIQWIYIKKCDFEKFFKEKMIDLI